MSSVYTDRSTLNKIYGKDNIDQWADLRNTGNSATITETIDYAIERAGMHIDGRLYQGPYKVPFEQPYPDVIVYLAALKAGLLLWDGRQIVDAEEPSQVSRQESEFEELINRILARTFKIHELSAAGTDYIKVYREPLSVDLAQNCFPWRIF